LLLNEETPIGEAKESLNKMNDHKDNHFIIVNNDGECRGMIATFELFNTEMPSSQPVSTISSNNFASILPEATLSEALEKMASTNTDTLPVVNNLQTNHVVGALSWENIASAYQYNSGNHEIKGVHISLRRTGLRMLVRGKKIISLKPALQAKRKA
jgi:Mg/Co/Ni transporter MgtE